MTSPPDQLRALTSYAFEELADGAGGLASFHRAIADRAFRASGAGAKPAEAIHGVVTKGVYGALRGSAELAGRATDVVLSQRPDTGTPVSRSGAGALLVGALNGLRGDHLEERGNAVAEPMSVRVRGEIVPPERGALAAAFPHATGRVVVFVHGLMGTERTWRWYRTEDRPPYGDRLEADLGATALHVRYNTGLHISENGALLARLLDDLAAAWPVELEEVALVGHSMGGLVARSACWSASEQQHDWAGKVRHVVSLGTPHLGAPIAQGLYYAVAGLDRLPETRPIANLLKKRSSGIRDLRQGSLVDEDWRDLEPDTLQAKACQEVPLLEGATHCFVTATVTRSARHPIGRLVGDTLVLAPSGSGRSKARRIPFRDADGLHVGPTHHIALLNHPEVYEQLRAWLSVAPERVAEVTPA
jgi:pimeloyl-ACP methyl ester carboxylesterase